MFRKSYIFLAIIAIIVSATLIAEQSLKVVDAAPVLTLDLQNGESSESNLTGVSGETQIPAKISVQKQTKDGTETWLAISDFDLFQATYGNEVKSEDGDDVIAPGTSNKCLFKISNSGSNVLRYQMTMQAKADDMDIEELPVVVRLMDSDGNYIIGSDQEWASLNEFFNVDREVKLKAKHYDLYTLEWKWEFEEDDERDTSLGNLAVEDDLNLTISLYTITTEIYDAEASSGAKGISEDTNALRSLASKMAPKTGDEWNPLFWIGLLVLCVAAGVIGIITFGKKKGERRDE